MSKRSIPGSIFVPKGRKTLVIKLKGKNYYTGLKDTKENRRLAEQKLRRLYLANLGVGEVAPKTIREALRSYEKTLVRVNDHTKHYYLLAIDRVLTDKYAILSPENIESQVLNFLQQRIKDVSKNTYIKAVQVFLNYCAKMGWMAPFKATDYSPRVRKQEAKSFSEDELIRLFSVTQGTEFGRLIEFMVETGARTIDALTLEWHQIDFPNNKIIWQNKITKDPELRPASMRAMEILSQQIGNKKCFSWSYSSASRLNRHLHRAMEKAKIEPDGRSFQEFRVTFRMRHLKKGTPEVYTQWLLRHKTFQITGDFYTNFDAFGSI